MKAQYLQLTGRKVRIEVNWNMTIDFYDKSKISMEEFAKLGAANMLTPRNLRLLAWCAAREGERMDGKKLDMDELAFGSLLSPAAVTKFVKIFEQQYSGSGNQESKKKVPGKMKKIFSRGSR